MGEFLRVLEAIIQGPRKLEGSLLLIVGHGLCGEHDVPVLGRHHEQRVYPGKA
jgi:hypothetical protein